ATGGSSGARPEGGVGDEGGAGGAHPGDAGQADARTSQDAREPEADGPSSDHAVLEPGDIYVSPLGSDDNSGRSADKPVKTLQKAQELVRGMNADMSHDLHVFLADGYHRLTKPLVLDPLDSGTNGHEVIWTAADGADPVVVGSVPVTGWSQV